MIHFGLVGFQSLSSAIFEYLCHLLINSTKIDDTKSPEYILLKQQKEYMIGCILNEGLGRLGGLFCMMRWHEIK